MGMLAAVLFARHLWRTQPCYLCIWSQPQQSSSEGCCLLPQRCLYLFVGGTSCCEVPASNLSGFALWRTNDSKCLQVRYTSSLCSFSFCASQGVGTSTSRSPRH